MNGSQFFVASGQLEPAHDEDAPTCFEKLALHQEQLWALGNFCILVWELKSKELVYRRDGSFPLDSAALFFSSEEKYFATARGRGDFVLWDAESFEQVRTFSQHREEVRGISFLNDGCLLSCSGDGSIRAWDINSAKQLNMIETPPCYCLALHPKEHQLAAGGSLGGQGWVTLFDPLSLEPLQEFKFDVSQQPYPTLSERGKRSAGITSVYRDKAVIDCLSWHPNGRHLWVGSWDRTIKVIDTHTGTHRELAGHSFWVSAIAFTEAGHAITSGGADGKVILWSHEGEQLQVLDLGVPVGDLCFSQGTLYIALGNEIRTFALTSK